MGFWQSSWWLYTWGGIFGDTGDPARAYIPGERSLGTLAIQLVAIHMGRDHWGYWQSSCWLYTWGGITGGQSSWWLHAWGGITGGTSNSAGGHMHGEGSQRMLAIQLAAIYMGRDHRGRWQSSWWLYAWAGITSGTGNPASGYIHGQGSLWTLAI